MSVNEQETTELTGYYFDLITGGLNKLYELKF
jgi:hypothetical protein